MEVRALRRRQLLRETLGYLTLPVLYGALMASGALLWVPSLVLLSLALVLLLLLQMRSGLAAGALAAAPQRERRRGKVPAKALEAADGCFLRQVDYTVLANAAGYLVFLVGIDEHLKASLRGELGSSALIAGALVGIAIAIAGREAARRAAWGRYAAVYPTLWSAPTGLDGGRAARSTRDYFDWRSTVEAEP